MNYKELFHQIKLVILDVDGVLTDGSLILMPDGSMSRKMNTRDGFAMKYAIDKGLIIAIITGGKDPSVADRLKGLGITDIYLNSHHKIEDYKDIKAKYSIENQEILYMGDDIPDFEVMQQVGLACCPHDACPEIRNISKYVSHVDGGKGCVRDVLEQLLKVQGKWEFQQEDDLPTSS